MLCKHSDGLIGSAACRSPIIKIMIFLRGENFTTTCSSKEEPKFARGNSKIFSSRARIQIGNGVIIIFSPRAQKIKSHETLEMIEITPRDGNDDYSMPSCKVEYAWICQD